jgi:hypothetical protein
VTTGRNDALIRQSLKTVGKGARPEACGHTSGHCYPRLAWGERSSEPAHSEASDEPGALDYPSCPRCPALSVLSPNW